MSTDLGLGGCNEKLLGTLEVTALDCSLSLGHVHVGHRSRIVGLSHPHGIEPVLLVHVHVNGLTGL